MTARPQPTRHSANVIRRVRLLRKARNWSVRYLANLMTEGGCPIARTTLASLEAGKRGHITVDELCAFAAVFGVPLDELVCDGATCLACNDQPPGGFSCLTCRAGQA